MRLNYPKRLNPPSFLEFQKRFSSEESCAEFLAKQRWPNGWVCPRCNSTKAYWITARKLYECSKCHSQVSVTARTIFHKTRTPLQLWFWAAFLITTDKRGISSVGLGKQLGLSQKQAWFMLHKIRQAISWREERYQLDGVVELHECFFDAPKARGSFGSSSAKIKVLVGLSNDDQGKPRYIKFKVLTQINRAQMEPAVKKMIAPGARIKTDGLRCYLSLPSQGYRHERVRAREKNILKEMRWLHTMISNAKTLIGGTYHGLGSKHLQVYLDEFAYRFGRRHMLDRIVDRCILAMATSPIWTYRNLIEKVDIIDTDKNAA